MGPEVRLLFCIEGVFVSGKGGQRRECGGFMEMPVRI